MVFLVWPEPTPRRSLSIKKWKDLKSLDTQGKQKKLSFSTYCLCKGILSLFLLCRPKPYPPFKAQLNPCIFHEFLLIYNFYHQYYNLYHSMLSTLFFVVLYMNINSADLYISIGQNSCLILFNNNEEL